MRSSNNKASSTTTLACSTCGLHRPLALFENTERNQRKPRCKACILRDVDMSSPVVVSSTTKTTHPTKTRSSPSEEKKMPDDTKTTTARLDEQQQQMNDLLEALLHPDRIWAVPEHLRQPRELQQYITEVLLQNHNRQHQAQCGWLIRPLIDGLIKGGVHVNRRVAVSTASPLLLPLLTWVCQWKYLQHLCQWKGADEMVAMVLATPGVAVNEVLFNQQNAAFYAVLHGSPTTLDLLAKCGIDLQQRDTHRRTILANACEFPHAAMLRKVLNHCSCVTTETVGPGGVTAADRLLEIAVMVSSSSSTIKGGSDHYQPQADHPTSWKMRGCAPTAEDVAEAMIVVRQRGAKVSPKHAAVCYAALATRCPDQLFLQSLVGLWLPQGTKDRIRIRDQDESMTTMTTKNEGSVANHVTERIICAMHGNNNTSSPGITMYCGHAFCQNCIRGYNQGIGGRPLCPICCKRLSKNVLALLSPATAKAIGATEAAGSGDLKNDRNDLEHEQLKSIAFLADSQVLQEAKLQGIYSVSDFFLGTRSLREKLLTHVLKGHMLQIDSGGDDAYNAMSDASGWTSVLDLAAANTHVVMGQDYITKSPLEGPVTIEITIKGVTLLAHISNTSRFTTVSASVVKNFNLKRLPELFSYTFEGSGGKTTISLENFSFSLDGGIEVTLDNAYEISDCDLVGIQLGQDFFESALYCVVDTKVEGAIADRRGNQMPLYMRCDGLFSWFDPTCGAESLRYYARNGKMTCLPLFHLNSRLNSATEDVVLKVVAEECRECNWCCRVVPSDAPGWIVHTRGEICYCSERCQAAAKNVHP